MLQRDVVVEVGVFFLLGRALESHSKDYSSETKSKKDVTPKRFFNLEQLVKTSNLLEDISITALSTSNKKRNKKTKSLTENENQMSGQIGNVRHLSIRLILKNKQSYNGERHER